MKKRKMVNCGGEAAQDDSNSDLKRAAARIKMNEGGCRETNVKQVETK